MSHGEVIIRFEGLSFEYNAQKPILDDVSFSVRRGMKVTIMGQNGAGKSTLFGLITGTLKPEDGVIHITKNATVALSRQVIPRDELDLTVREFFQKCFQETIYNIDKRIDDVLEIVHLPQQTDIHDRKIKMFSGGQQARLLLASALIQEPDILLLDEPTNNLDKQGIAHLTDFLVQYKKTVIVISHDATFLNAFTDAVLYLDVYTKKIEQYVGNYTHVRDQIAARMERENRKNALLAKEIQAKKDQANKFAMKGGNLRAVAKRMRTLADELEEEKVDVRKEDKTIRPFSIPVQENISGDILVFSSVSLLKNHEPVSRQISLAIRKNQHLLLSGPNGIGKSTLLENLAHSRAVGGEITKGIRVGYYRQDFSTLDFQDTPYKSLSKTMLEIDGKIDEEYIRSLLSGFLIVGQMVHTPIGSLSEGQKGLVAFAQLVLIRPGLLILDEPTNHINFRHLPLIAKALHDYEGAMVLVSHVHEFVEQIRVDEELNLGKLLEAKK
jgi:ATPase subunit of ABC transporter with duplicated ATPase domains